MVRTSWLTLVAVVLATVVLVSTWLWQNRLPSAGAGTSIAEGPRPILPDVEVRHEIVRLSPGPPPASIRAQGHRVQPVRQTPPRVFRARRDESLLDKARRTVVGDGRYRPEPFPRVR